MGYLWDCTLYFTLCVVGGQGAAVVMGGGECSGSGHGCHGYLHSFRMCFYHSTGLFSGCHGNSFGKPITLS